jgi:hypothetical protein
LHVWAAKQTGENIPKSVNSGMLVEIATNRSGVVIAVEEPLGGDNLWLWLCGQLLL